MTRRLSRDFFARETLDVARELIGLELVLEAGGYRRVGRIVETEAYKGPEDLAAHSARGRSDRNAVMFGPPGHAYVYLIYGIWHCFNIVTESEGVPHAVLIRAVEPLTGLQGRTWGPGLLCRSFGIDRGHNGIDLCGSSLWLEQRASPQRAPRIGRSPRIGVDYAGRWARKPWRFFDRDSLFVSTVSHALRRRAGLALTS